MTTSSSTSMDMSSQPHALPSDPAKQIEEIEAILPPYDEISFSDIMELQATDHSLLFDIPPTPRAGSSDLGHLEDTHSTDVSTAALYDPNKQTDKTKSATSNLSVMMLSRSTSSSSLFHSHESMPQSSESASSPSVRFHVTPQHKHKRVRSSSDMFQSFLTEMNVNQKSKDLNKSRLEECGFGNNTAPMLHSMGRPATLMPESDDFSDAVMHSVQNSFQMGGKDGLIAPLPIAIGPVRVTSPIGLQFSSNIDGNQDPKAKTKPELQDNNADHEESDTFAKLDSHLGDFSWIGEHVNHDDEKNGSSNQQTNQLNHLTSFHDDANESKGAKRKRPPTHTRRHSNPSGLMQTAAQLHADNGDMFRFNQALSQQSIQNTMMLTNSYSHNGQYSSYSQSALTQSQNAAFNSNAQTTPYLQSFPSASNASGSMHIRRSSLPASVLQAKLANARLQPSVNAKLPPPARDRRGNHRSTGLSMDLSDMNLGFLGVLDSNNSHSSFDSSSKSVYSSSFSLMHDDSNVNRKLYKCGRCGQPKVGHVCTMPDQRNNWTQVDLEITKGLKVQRSNCHFLTVKAPWKPQHPDNL